jgi:hypothetical protein
MQHVKPTRYVSLLLGFAGLALATTVALASQATGARPAPPAKAASTQAPKSSGGPMRQRVSAPPLPNVGFAPVRPMDVVRATYDFAAQHPEILKYVPCYCGCGSQGHKANESCFVARRDAQGNVLEWDTHGFGCTICIDVGRKAMQMYTSGADVHSIRAAIEREYASSAEGRTPTPAPPAKKSLN